MEKKILSLLTIITVIIAAFYIFDSYYYKSYSGDGEIIFIEFEGSDQKDYYELFELPQLKGKWVYVTLNLRGDWENYQPDLEMMDSLYDRFNKSNITFLYTVDSIDHYSDKYEWKKTIKKYHLKGYHIDLPEYYEYGLWEEAIVGNTESTKIPKYMIVSDKGELIDKWAPKPRDFEKLVNRFDSLLKK